MVLLRRLLGRRGKALRLGPASATTKGRYFCGGWCGSLFGLRGEVYGAEEARRDGHDLVEILHLKAIAVLGNQRFIVVRRQSRPGVESGVIDADLNMVDAGLQQAGDIKAI